MCVCAYECSYAMKSMFNDADLNQLNHIHNHIFVCSFGYFLVVVVRQFLFLPENRANILFVVIFVLLFAIDTINCD